MSKIERLVELLQSVSEAELSMLSRADLVELGNAAFGLSGDVEIELQFRGASSVHRDSLVPH